MLFRSNSELDYRLRTSDPAAARRLTLDTPAVGIIDDADGELLVVRTQLPGLDELVSRLVRAGIAVRELAPVVSPLEAAFLALTEQEEAGR